MNSKRKLKTLVFADKIRVIEAVKSGMKRKDVAAQFGIHESTLSLILKKEPELLKKLQSGQNLLSKRLRNAEFPYLEQCLYTWFKQCLNNNICVNGPILKRKAEEFAKSLEIHHFKASNGWFENFKKRHDLAFRRIYDESSYCDGYPLNHLSEIEKKTIPTYSEVTDFELKNTAERVSESEECEDNKQLIKTTDPLLIGENENFETDDPGNTSKSPDPSENYFTVPNITWKINEIPNNGENDSNTSSNLELTSQKKKSVPAKNSEEYFKQREKKFEVKVDETLNLLRENNETMKNMNKNLQEINTNFTETNNLLRILIDAIHKK